MRCHRVCCWERECEVLISKRSFLFCRNHQTFGFFSIGVALSLHLYSNVGCDWVSSKEGFDREP